MTRTLSSFLADRSQEELQRMKAGLRQTRERLYEEAKKLEFEEEVVDEALAKKQKRRGTGRGRSQRQSASGGVRITREQVLEFVNSHFTGFFNSTHVVSKMAEEGIKTNSEAVRQHLRRLADNGEISRDGRGFTPRAGDANGHRIQASPNGTPPAGEGRELSFEVGAR